MVQLPPGPLCCVLSLLESGSDAAGFSPSKERRRHLVVIAGIAVPVLKLPSQAMFVGPTKALGMDWGHKVGRKSRGAEVRSVATYCNVKSCTQKSTPE